MSVIFDRASILVSERVGRTQSLTPEGFLLCTDVRIARTGEMQYASHEIRDIAPLNGVVTLVRDAEVLFSEATVASFSGKPVTNDHPPSFVDPANFKRHTVGIVLDPRRGVGDEAEFLIADLLIMDAKAIADVQAGKREVSCGYDCSREQIRPGLGRQIGVLGNHVALVARGRAGPACAIKDGDSMTNPTTFIGRIRAAFTAQDRDQLEATLDQVKPVLDADQEEEEDKDKKKDDMVADAMAKALAPITEALSKVNDRLAAVEKRVVDADEEEKKDDEDDMVVKDAFTDLVARAEIVAPGVSVPTYDPKKSGAQVIDMARAALTQARADSKKTAIVDAMGPIDKLNVSTAILALKGVSEAVKVMNSPRPPAVMDGGIFAAAGAMTAAKLQQINEAARQRK